jgi:orotidine-5'-phosphate decarboxylase
MPERIINSDKSIVIAADVAPPDLPNLVKKTCTVEGVGGYKVGIELVLSEGLPRVVSKIKDNTNLPIIYDHQKGGIDIPNMGKKFAETCKRSGVDAVILFPLAGPISEITWIRECKEKALKVIVGAHMTHPSFLKKESGFIEDNAPMKVFEIAIKEGVKDFVVPGNNPSALKKYFKLFTNELGQGNFVLWAPGFITQGGEIGEFDEIAKCSWHAIIGSAIYNAENINAAAKYFSGVLKNR